MTVNPTPGYAYAAWWELMEATQEARDYLDTWEYGIDEPSEDLIDGITDMEKMLRRMTQAVAVVDRYFFKTNPLTQPKPTMEEQ